MTEKIPSSVMLGARPMIFSTRSYSSGVSPCSAATRGVIAGSTAVGLFTPKPRTRQVPSRQSFHDAFEHGPAVGRALQGFHRVFRMGHQAQDIFGVVEDARDVAGRAVRVGIICERAIGAAITKGDLAFVFQPIE